MEKTLQGCFAEVNSRGGIYSRRLDLVVARGGTPVAKDLVSGFLQERDIFALVSTFIPELDQEIPALVEEETIPLVGPFTLFPATELALNRYLFYILSGLREQARVLISFASGKPKFRDPRLVILYPARGDLREVIEAVEEQGKGKKWKKMTRREYPVNQFEAAKWVELLRKEDADLILFFGIEPETREFLKEIQKANWTPGLLLPGVLMGKAVYEIPPALKDKVFISFPTLAEDRKEKGMREFMSLVQKYNLPTTHLGAQLSAYAAAQILLESLRRVGRDLSRERFIATLERMHEFDTGLTPLITFNPNRHIGALGAYVVTVDPGQQGKKEFISSQKWVNLD